MASSIYLFSINPGNIISQTGEPNARLAYELNDLSFFFLFTLNLFRVHTEVDKLMMALLISSQSSQV